MYQPAPAQQQPQVIIVQPAYQTQFGQSLQQQPAATWPQPAYTQQYVPQYQPQFQYGQRPWGETGSYGQQQTFGVPYGTPQAPAGGTYPGWGVSPPGTFPGNPYTGSIW